MPTISFSAPATVPIEMMLLMWHPTNAVERARGFVMLELDRQTRDEPHSQICLSAEQTRLLLEARPLSDLKEHQKQCTKQGFLAGRLLACLYLCHRFKDVHHYFVPSMNRALYVCTYQGRVGGKFGDGTPLPRSERPVREAWNSYSTVAHYWAAMSMASLGYPFAPERKLFAPEHFPKFLGVAAALHRFGTSFVPEGARPAIPILDAATSWAPPVGVVPAELKSTRVPDVLKTMLQTYRAPK